MLPGKQLSSFCSIFVVFEMVELQRRDQTERLPSAGQRALTKYEQSSAISWSSTDSSGIISTIRLMKDAILASLSLATSASKSSSTMYISESSVSAKGSSCEEAHASFS